MHDTLQLKKACSEDKHIKTFFLDVFAADQIPNHLPSKFLFIANTDPISKPGRHWVLFFRRNVNEEPFFFDSYGRSPSSYNGFWKRFDSFRRSKEDVQQKHTTVCGDHCLYVAKRLCSGKSLEKSLECYDAENEKGNDERVFALVHAQFKHLNSIDHVNVTLRRHRGSITTGCQMCEPRQVLQ